MYRIHNTGIHVRWHKEEPKYITCIIKEKQKKNCQLGMFMKTYEISPGHKDKQILTSSGNINSDQ